MLLSVFIVLNPAITGGALALVWHSQASLAFYTLSAKAEPSCVPLNSPCFLCAALASKPCLKPAELNLPRLTTVYAGFSYITAVAAFHVLLIQNRLQTARPRESHLPLGACTTPGTGLCVFKCFTRGNNYPIIPDFGAIR